MAEHTKPTLLKLALMLFAISLALEVTFVALEGMPDRLPWLLIAATVFSFVSTAVLTHIGGCAVKERKRAEKEIETLNEEIEERIKVRTAKLARAYRDLMQNNQENEMFAYSIFHDLRSPLVNLDGFRKELVLSYQEIRGILAEGHLPAAQNQRCLALLDGDVAESIHFIQSGVKRLSGIIDALLRLTRAGRVEYQSQLVDVRSAVDRIIESMSATIHERAATVKVKDLPPVGGDPTAVEQIFANLICNALNYLDPERPGFIEVGSATYRGHMAAALESGVRSATIHSASLHASMDAIRNQSDLHTYYVKDNGLGIPKASRAKVFQAFQRIHPEVAQGEGMGLTIVHRIIQRHGGRIWFEPVEGGGTCFFLTLPRPRVGKQ